MKKLLVLVSILAIASLASAATMEIYDFGDGTYGIDVPSGMSGKTDVIPMLGDGSGSYWVMIGVDVSSGAISATIPAIMSLSGIYGDADGTGLFATGLGVVGEFRTPAVGTWSAAGGQWADSFTAQEGVLTLYLYAVDDGVSVATLIDTLYIPEPATIALLCLGGLLLRKK